MTPSHIHVPTDCRTVTEILSLETGAISLNRQPETADITILTVLGKELLRTEVHSSGRRGHRHDGEGANLHLGDHPCAEVLRALNLGAASSQSREVDLQMDLPAASGRYPLSMIADS